MLIKLWSLMCSTSFSSSIFMPLHFSYSVLFIITMSMAVFMSPCSLVIVPSHLSSPFISVRSNSFIHSITIFPFRSSFLPSSSSKWPLKSPTINRPSFLLFSIIFSMSSLIFVLFFFPSLDFLTSKYTSMTFISIPKHVPSISRISSFICFFFSNSTPLQSLIRICSPPPPRSFFFLICV